MLKWVVWAGIGRASATNAAQSILTCRPSVTGIKWRCTKDEEQGLESEGCMGISIGRFAMYVAMHGGQGVLVGYEPRM